jgi:small-conductance mechanosensitive channel
MSIQSVNSEIIAGNFTNDQLTSIVDAVKFARSRLGQQTKWSLRIGDNVNFTSSKLGQNVTGTVVKIAIKFVTVQTVKGLWRVPANMLSKVAEYA